MVFQDLNRVNNLSSINNVLTWLLDMSHKFMSMFYLFIREQKLHVFSCLDRVRLLDKAYLRVYTLSGGQKQCIGIARALGKQPVLLLADELVASIDPMIAHTILSLRHNIGRAFGITVSCNLH
jgi:phosphonate transport system ATP-binding protein